MCSIDLLAFSKLIPINVPTVMDMDIGKELEEIRTFAKFVMVLGKKLVRKELFRILLGYSSKINQNAIL
jgi:hypothetical protein